MSRIVSKLPRRIRLGEFLQTTIYQPAYVWKEHKDAIDPLGRRMVMGYLIPEYQRGLVWSREQEVSFVESFIKGIPIGTYTYTSVNTLDDQINLVYDRLLLDGQQRLKSLERWFSDEFSACGVKWSELEKPDQRELLGRPFSSFEVRDVTDDAYLRDYYNLMNFSGVRHTEEERA